MDDAKARAEKYFYELILEHANGRMTLIDAMWAASKYGYDAACADIAGDRG